jgi:phosphoribosylamine--glycine ligase
MALPWSSLGYATSNIDGSKGERAMKVLVVGGGGREHALVRKIAESPQVTRLFCAPGNAGIAAEAEPVNIPADTIAELAAFARSERIDLTVVGPEVPLTEGIVDEFIGQGLRIFGPSRAAARLEGSKSFAKELMRKTGIPTAAATTFTETAAALNYLEQATLPVVVKADGLAAGKGVIIARDRAEAAAAVRMMLQEKVFGKAGNKVLIEEYLEGEEVSVLAFTDGETVIPLVSAQDHKRVYDGDQGPNTGGMGAYSPAPAYTPEMAAEVYSRILVPTVAAMAAEGCQYRGVLYAGLMLTAAGPRVLEYNARFGDPETQVILPRLESDLVEIMEAIIDGTLAQTEIRWREESAVCVVMAAGGYPGKYEKGKVITGLSEAASQPGVTILHAGTALADGKIVTAGGRVLGVTALGADIRSAIDRAYAAAARIDFAGAHYRRDIGYRALAKE